MPRKIDTATGRVALDAVRAAEQPARTDLATSVRYLLQLLEERAPGKSVEVRVPPFGAVQVIQGPAHTRGTPPNVIETDPATWIALATGDLAWPDARDRISASGTRADISHLLPVRW
ncbi:sterol carrier family protein [Microbacterium sp. G2-8]|uniref:sterol carrier family protein n=1 Tax=Microbacterium sp. G2-8 TaxID=2842454 RepID=UPI001C8A381C|nr:sterol carrier family protein [Microbacterium sp. G2-8]